MNKVRILSALLLITLCGAIVSCSSTIKTTGFWVNKEKLPAQPVKSVFIIAFTDNMEARKYLENDLAAAAEQKGIKAYTSLNVIGPVDIKLIAPVKDVFIKKLQDLNCESIFTIALVHEISETKYVSGSTIVYAPYPYNQYGGYGGYGASGPYGGFGGYYGYAASTMSTQGYYKSDNKYFLEAKMFDLKTDELLFSIQSKAHNPKDIQKSGKEYTASLMEEINSLSAKRK